MDLIFDIPPRPTVLIELNEEMIKLDPDLAVLERIIGRDVGISAMVLKLANSSSFGGRRHFGALKDAVAFLGLDVLVSLVTGAVVRKLFQAGPAMEAFWDKSVTMAETMSKLVNTWEYKALGLKPSEAYTFGLFLNCGSAILLMNLKDYTEACASCEYFNRADYEIQQYGVTHVGPGYMLAEKWGLPAHIALGVRYHHERSKYAVDDRTVPDATKQLMALAILADKGTYLDGPAVVKDATAWLNYWLEGSP